MSHDGKTEWEEWVWVFILLNVLVAGHAMQITPKMIDDALAQRYFFHFILISVNANKEPYLQELSVYDIKHLWP